MKVYESVIIVNSSLNEETVNRIVSRCEDLIKKQKGKLGETVHWGKRRLAYPIKKFQYGFYIIFNFEAPPETIVELEREYRLNEHILRFMTIYKDKKAILAEQMRKEEEAKLKIAEQEEEEAQKSEDESSDDAKAGKTDSATPAGDESTSEPEPEKTAADDSSTSDSKEETPAEEEPAAE